MLKVVFKKCKVRGAPGWLSQLSIRPLISAQVMISQFLSSSSAWDSLSLTLCLSLKRDTINFKKILKKKKKANDGAYPNPTESKLWS